MTINKEYVKNIVSSVGIFILLSIPSIKLVYSSNIINALAISFIFMAVILKFNDKLPRVKVLLLCVWSLFSLVIIANFFNGNHLNSGDDLGKYLYLILAIYFLIIISNFGVLSLCGYMLFLWGLFLSIWQIHSGIPTSSALGQHYLTVALPIAISLVYCYRAIFSKNSSWLVGLFYLTALLLCLLALSTLLSRSAILFSSMIFVLLGSASVILQGSVRSRAYISLGAIGLLGFLYYMSSYLLSFQQADRISRLFLNPYGEPRVEGYIKAFEFISSRPIIGHGTNSSAYLYGNYPHNIFLEIASHGGVILTLPFMFLLIVYFRSANHLARINMDQPSLLGFFSISLYFFLQWNTSFDITTAYIPLGAAILFILGYEDYTKRAASSVNPR